LSGTFDFCDTSRVIQEIPPEPTNMPTFNGWEFSSKPQNPYRRTFTCKLHGLRWYLNSAGSALDVTTNPKFNAGRLLDFYRANQTWDTFTLVHEYLGTLQVKFKAPVVIPPAISNSDGLVPEFELQLIHSNPSY